MKKNYVDYRNQKWYYISNNAVNAVINEIKLNEGADNIMRGFTKKILSIFLVLCLVLSVLPAIGAAAESTADENVWDGSVATGFASGSGSQLNPYLITNGAELAYLAKLINIDANMFATTYFKLGADIILNPSSAFRYDGEMNITDVRRDINVNKWTPIGAYMPEIRLLRRAIFAEFDGGGHTISGLYVDTEDDYAGLFGSAYGLIKDVTVETSYVRGASYVGTIAGDKKGLSHNIRTGKGLVSGLGIIGGLFGGHYNDGIESCHNSANVVLNTYIKDYTAHHLGGIAGEVEFHYIRNSTNKGNITAELPDFSIPVAWDSKGVPTRYEPDTPAIIRENEKTFTGGITSRIKETVIENCYNTGTITGGFNAGGIIGLGTGNISSSFNTGDVKQLADLSPKHAGGIAGGLEGRNFFIENCYNFGYISANFAGGIVGKNYSIALRNSYTTITPFTSEGYSHSATSGTTTTYSLEENCFFSAFPLLNFYETITEKSDVRVKTSDEMKEQAFVDQLNNGASVWEIDAEEINGGYPILSGIEYGDEPVEPPPPPPPPPPGTFEFTDVKEANWFYEDVIFCAELGIMRGTSKTKFSPGSMMTREMFVTVLGRMAELSGAETDGFESEFTDVPKNGDYYKYISWANSNGIVNGISKTKFGYKQTVTREQAATFVMRYADFMGYELPLLTDGDLAKFSDEKSISKYARPSMIRMVEAQLFEGYRSKAPTPGEYVYTLKPKAGIKRSEAAKVFHQFMEAVEK